MGPEILVGFVAVFISGGAIGSTGILLAQWLLKRMDGEPLPRRSLEAAEFDVLRGEVAEIGKHLDRGGDSPPARRCAPTRLWTRPLRRSATDRP